MRIVLLNICYFVIVYFTVVPEIRIMFSVINKRLKVIGVQWIHILEAK